MSDHWCGQRFGEFAVLVVQAFHQVLTRFLCPAWYFDQSQYFVRFQLFASIDRFLHLSIQLSEGFHIDIKSLATEVVASRSTNDECAVVQLFADQAACYVQNASTSFFALLGKCSTFGYEVVLETIGQHYVGRFVQQLLTFAVSKGTYRSEAVSAVSTLLFDAMLGFHRKFVRHLVTVVSFEVFVEQFVVASDRASHARSVSCKDRSYAWLCLLQKQHTQARHPFVCLVDDLLCLANAVFCNDFYKSSSCIAKHRRFVVVAVCLDRIYLEVFPCLSIDVVFVCHQGLEIHQYSDRLTGYVPSTDAYVQTRLSRGSSPLGQQLLVFLENVFTLS